MLNIIIALLSGILIGCSVGFGFIQIYKQPKNLKIQIILSIVGFILLIFLILSLK